MKALLLTACAALAMAATASARVPPPCPPAVSIYEYRGCVPATPAAQPVAPFQVDVLGGDGHPATTPPGNGIATWYLVGIGAGSGLAVAGVALLLLYGRRRRSEAHAVLA
jgi:hypothetical protein